MAQVETIRVKCPIVEGNDTGFYVVNKADFAEGMELFDAPAEQQEEPAPAIAPSWQQ